MLITSAFQAARLRIVNATDAINQHAQKVFETAELILGEVAERVDDMDWPEIASSDALHRMLVELGRRPRVAIVGLIGPDGLIVANNLSLPLTPVALSERSYLQVDRPGAGPLFISSVADSVFTGKPDFIVARYLKDMPRSGMRNMIFVALDFDNFTDYSQTIIDSGDYLLNMSRSDGAVLVRFPGELAGRVFWFGTASFGKYRSRPRVRIAETASELDGSRGSSPTGRSPTIPMSRSACCVRRLSTAGCA